MNETVHGTDLVTSNGHAVLSAPALITDAELDRTFRLAKALALSRMFKDAHQAEQALAKILIGRDLGLSPTQAMMGLHIVEGKPEIAATTLAMFVRRLPGISYKVVEHTDEACEIHFFEGDDLLGVSRFTKDDADKAGLLRPTRSGQPSNHSKFPRNMNFARAMSNGVKWHVPEAIAGIPVYHEGEVHDGTAVDITPEAPEPEADPAPDAQDDREPDLPDEDAPEPGRIELLDTEIQNLIADLLVRAREEAGWDDKRIVMTLGAYGALDTSSIESGVATLPAAKVGEFELWVKDSISDAIDAKAAAEAEEAKS